MHFLLLFTFFFGCKCASDSQWHQRTIYQLLTDRFARTDGSTSPCGNIHTYCGGTFQGIVKKLDYIQDMGFDAIWISPVVENTKDGYHGYWAKNIYQVNHYFGSEQDLINLGNALHQRGMYLMIDVVANHMGIPPNYDYSQLTPFNSASDFHDCNGCPSDCNIHNFNKVDYELQHCRLSGLPDLNQENSNVANTLISWVKQYVVDKWQADGIRIDTVPEVPGSFWKKFTASAGVYSVGEVFNGDPSFDGPFSYDMSAVLDYPMFYSIRQAFGQQQGMGQLDDRLKQNSGAFRNSSLLGTFVDNHDNTRFLNSWSDQRLYEGAITYTLMSPGIPIIYYGTEQAFAGGNDPNNREPLWTSQYNTNSALYQFIKTVISARKTMQVYNRPYVMRAKQNDFYVFTRGSAIVALTNCGSNGPTKSYSVNVGVPSGRYCNVFWPKNDCINVSGSVQLNLLKGESKIYIPASEIDKLGPNAWNFVYSPYANGTL